MGNDKSAFIGRLIHLFDARPAKIGRNPEPRAGRAGLMSQVRREKQGMYQRIPALLVAALAGGIVGAMVTIQFNADPPRSRPSSAAEASGLLDRWKRGEQGEPDAQQLARMVDSLVDVLDEEIAERRILAEQLEQTRTEMNDLQQNLRARVEAAFDTTTDTAESASIGRNRQNSREEREQALQQRLVAAGFSREQVEYLERRQAEGQMLQIELDDRARREGWIGTTRYAEESAKLTSGADVLRQELGDAAYDRYLFASGRPNRIEVASVIQTSPAERAGLRRGDIISRYAGEKIFSSEQLTGLRSAGDRGAPVVVDIIRDGQPMRITVPRGPMGIQTQQSQLDPAADGGG
jgi:C-terminal processing protease CtpA/Prc